MQAAGEQYDASARAWREEEGPGSQNALAEELQHVVLEVRSQAAGSPERAKALLDQQETVLRQVRRPTPTVRFLQAEAEGTYAALDGNSKEAEPKLQQGVELAPKAGTAELRPAELELTARSRLCTVEARLGEGAKAESCFRRIIAEV